MAEQVGLLLWQMRTARGWSLGQLAQRSGVHKSALSRWESGDRFPRIPELDAVLNALEATTAQRHRVYSLLEAPRALRQLKAFVAPSGGMPPAAGDLLRAMRLRGGWTQTQIATRIGVRQHTLARWEQGERLPSTEQMQALCFALEAQEEELVALTRGHFSEMVEEIPKDRFQVLEILNCMLLDPHAELLDLRYLTLERGLWHWTLQEEQAASLLATAYAEHAHALSLGKRWGEVRALAQQALALTPSQEALPGYASRAVIKLAAALVYGGNQRLPTRGFRLLKDWLPQTSESGYRAWMLSEMGEYLAMMGEVESAVELGEKAVSVTEHEREMRQLDQGRLLLIAGNPMKALEQLPSLSEDCPGMLVYESLLRCEAYLNLGRLEEASAWLQRSFAVMEAKGLSHNRSQAEELAKRCGAYLAVSGR